jgi:hypothetical protein
VTKKILTTTGLLMPPNNLFEVYQEKLSQFDSFIGRDNNFTLNNIASYYRTNHVSFSPQADALYIKYQADKSFESFVAMVDFMAEVLSQVECKTFMEWQAYNRHTSVVTMSLCRDLLTGKLERFHQYDNLTPHSRFVMNQAITKEVGKQRHTLLMQGVNPGEVSWVHLLTPLMKDRGNFLVMFKYFFVNTF